MPVPTLRSSLLALSTLSSVIAAALAWSPRASGHCDANWSINILDWTEGADVEPEERPPESADSASGGLWAQRSFEGAVIDLEDHDTFTLRPFVDQTIGIAVRGPASGP